MQFLTLASVFAAALAAPAPQTSDCPNPAHCGAAPDPAHYENVNIEDYSLRKNNGTIQSVYFKLSAGNATDLVCQTGATPSLPGPVVICGDSDYRFGLTAPQNGTSDAGLAIYHETSPFAGKWAIGPAPPTYCHAGGNGPDDFVCSQVSAYTIVITS
jgi:hypothetical protein